jgi:hypothetical protein
MGYLSNKHREDLFDRSGLSQEIIDESGVYSCSAKESCSLLDRKDINCESLVFPYPESGDPLFVRLKPDGAIIGSDGKAAKYLQRGGTRPRLYALPIIRAKISDNFDEDTLPILFTEGEKKVLKATQELFYNDPICLPIGFGGVWNWRYTEKKWNKDKEIYETKKYVIPELEEINFENRIVYICFDSNVVVNNNVLQAELELGNYLTARKARRVSAIRIPHELTEQWNLEKSTGIDDYLCRKTSDDFKQLISNSISNHLVKYSIEMIRQLDLNAKDKLDLITKIIIKDQKASGELYNSTSGCYFFFKKESKVYRIEQGYYGMLLGDSYGLYRNDHEFTAILSKIEEEATFRGVKTDIENFAFYEDKTKSTYIYNNDGGMYVIGPTGVSLKPNGFNKILFRHYSDYTPIIYKQECTGYINKYLLDIANFQQSESTLLTQDQQKLLLTIWIYSMFFPNLLPAKPILVMTGEYGSGKSTIQKLLGKLLLGSSFEVNTFNTPRDFAAVVTNKPYAVYDQVDINAEWIRNAIAAVSTGQSFEFRKLYSNNEVFKVNPIAYLAMNSMSQSIYSRGDIASRLLIFRTKKLQQEIPAAILFKNIADFRNEILSELFDNLVKILPYINYDHEYKESFRMADFANLGFKIAKSFTLEYEFKTILKVLSSEQTALPLEDNPIVDLIEKWLAKGNYGKFVSTNELFGDLKRMCDENKLFFSFKTTVAFGKYLAMNLENFRQIFHIEMRKGGGNKTMWTFEHK